MLAYTKDNKVIHIKDALPKTDYYCGNCGGRLRVRNGTKKIKHFYHLDSDCGDRGESLIHKYWKKYFLSLKEFDGYNIIASMEEVHLPNIKYTPDVVLKTNKETYLVIEVCYKNPKDENYNKKFKKIKNLEKVYEIKVNFDKILETKILFDIETERRIEQRKKELQKEAEKIRQYILDKYYTNGGLVFDTDHHMPYSRLIFHKDLKPKYGYSSYKSKRQYRYIIKSSLEYKKIKVYLSISLHFKKNFLTEISTPFELNIYDYKNIYQQLKYFFELGEIVNEDIKELLNDKMSFIHINLVEE